MIRIILFQVLFLISGTLFSAPDECDEAAGFAAAENGQYQIAFSMLKPCEYRKNVSGKTLGTLAHLYIMVEYAQYDQYDSKMASKFYELIRRAALKGEHDALYDLSGIYDIGEPSLNIEPNILISNCLESIADKPDSYSQDNVQKCLPKEK